jgi:dihydroorotate dehydrogenase
MDTYRAIGPLLRLFPAETAHGLALWALRLGLVPAAPAPEMGPEMGIDDPMLASRVWGREFANPIGLAAGFDKDAQVIDAMFGTGFGFVEVGTITPQPQAGNPRPRLFRLPEDEAVINRLGFNSAGMAAAAANLERRRQSGRRLAGPVGINLGKNKDTVDAAADFAAAAELLSPFADYLAINVSSPNTPGLRALQNRAQLEDLLARVEAARTRATGAEGPPLVLKIAPDLIDEDLADIAEVALSGAIDGLIIGNTTIARPTSLISRRKSEAGGLSGRPLLALSTEILGKMYRLTDGKVPLIGVGGISSAEDALAKIRAGASLVALYSALIYQGPGLVSRIKARLPELLSAQGFSRLGDAVGADHRGQGPL